MTTPKIWYDATTPTENLAVFIVSDVLQIATFAKHFSTPMFPILQQLYALHVWQGHREVSTKYCSNYTLSMCENWIL